MAEPPISDEAVRKATGKGWTEWRTALDLWAGELPHKDIARRVKDEYGLSGWWAQAVTGGWEIMTGRRSTHEKPEGFQATGSKTIAADEALVRAAITEPSVFSGWAPKGGIEITTENPGKPVNARWLGPEGGRVVFRLTAAGDRTQLAVDHERLSDAETCERMKTAWRDALQTLKERLER